MGEKPGCLKLLLDKGATAFDIDKLHNTPLHAAADRGRAENIKLLVAKIKENDPDGAFLNKKNRLTFAPIHLAAKRGHADALEALLAAGATLELQTGAGKGKMTALMQAAEWGHLHLVKLLHTKYNAQLDKRDKLKRTALAHAVKHGQAHVASYLLKAGVNPDHPDSSGNRPVHYAAAFGWPFCLRLLIDAGAAINCPNDWALTPLAVAYMKGHMGLADTLLAQPGIDINCQDDRGLTLVSLTLTNGVQAATYNQLEYLLKAKKADVKIADSLGNTPLHILATSNVSLTYQEQQNLGRSQPKIQAAMSERLAKVLNLLLTHGADVSVKNEKGETALQYAVETRKLPMAAMLLQNGARLPDKDDALLSRTDNFLHKLAGFLTTDHDSKLAAHIFNDLVKSQPELMQTLLTRTDAAGYTPFLRVAENTTANEGTLDQPMPSYGALLNAIIDFAPSVLAQQVGKEAEKPLWRKFSAGTVPVSSYSFLCGLGLL